MGRKTDTSKKIQVAFLALLTIASAQVAWWVGENTTYSSAVERERIALYEDSARAFSSAFGERPAARAVPDYLEYDERSATYRVSAAAIAAAHEARDGRINRYFWEGGFFLFVLIAGMALLTTSLRYEEGLRRRQRNFLASVSHEFKSPLASIQLAADTLARRCSGPEIERSVPRIQADCTRLLTTVENLLDTARLEEGRYTVQAQTIKLAPIAQLIVEETRARANHHGIAIHCGDLEDLTLSADPAAVESILRNLVDNAIKACAAGDGKRIDIGARRHANRIELSVSDDGMGFPQDEAPRLFEKFYRVGDELRRRTIGTGLGLYIVQQFAGLSGARVSAHSEGVGRGARITVSWPDPGND